VTSIQDKVERQAPTDMRVLAAACDIAVIRALELIGKRVARTNGSYFGGLKRSGKGYHEAHEVYPLEAVAALDAALAGAWATLPRLVADHGCCSIADQNLTALLDSYVREVVCAAKPHEFEVLAARLAEASRGRA
jgi:hypothetical protein